MLRILMERLRQGRRTIAYPGRDPALPPLFQGRPRVSPERCPAGCRECALVCPTNAVAAEGGPVLDMGRCLFCGECAAACGPLALSFTGDFRLAARSRDGLVVTGKPRAPAAAPDRLTAGLFGRSLRLRQVSAGGCSACESDLNVLQTVVYDIGRLGIEFVASPRHADGILVTGPVTRNMRTALLKTWEAVPAPKLVIASGACAVSGGPYLGHPEAGDGVSGLLPVDLFIPGCPPHPLTVLEGLLRLLGRRS